MGLILQEKTLENLRVRSVHVISKVKVILCESTSLELNRISWRLHQKISLYEDMLLSVDKVKTTTKSFCLVPYGRWSKMWKLVNFTDELSLLVTSHSVCTCISTKSMNYYQECNFNESVHWTASKVQSIWGYICWNNILLTYICRFNMYPARKVKTELRRMFTLKK